MIQRRPRRLLIEVLDDRARITASLVAVSTLGSRGGQVTRNIRGSSHVALASSQGLPCARLVCARARRRRRAPAPAPNPEQAPAPAPEPAPARVHPRTAPHLYPRLSLASPCRCVGGNVKGSSSAGTDETAFFLGGAQYLAHYAFISARTKPSAHNSRRKQQRKRR